MFSRIPWIQLAYLAGAVLWLGWLVQVLGGTGVVDAAGQVIGTDFVMFYAAGVSLVTGVGDTLYDISAQHRLQRELLSATFSGTYNLYVTPIAALLYAPFSAFDYLTAFVLWTLFSVALLWHALRWLGAPLPLAPFLLALSSFPVFASFSYGQNSVLSLFIFSLVIYLWRRDWDIAAGVALSLILYKPHFAAPLILLMILRCQWRFLLSFCVSTLVLLATVQLLLPEALTTYVALVAERLLGVSAESSFPLSKQLSVQGFFLLAVGQDAAGVARALTAGVALLASALWLRFILHQSSSREEDFAATVFWTVLLVPHLMIYDASLLLMPLMLLWCGQLQDPKRTHQYVAVLWIALFISIPAVEAQMQFFGFGINPGTLAIAWCGLDYLRVRKPQSDRATAPL